LFAIEIQVPECLLQQQKQKTVSSAKSVSKNRKSDVARKLRISGMGIGKCVDRGKKILDKPEMIKEYLGQV